MRPIEQRLRDALQAEAELWPSPPMERVFIGRVRRRAPGWLVAGATAAIVLVVVAGAVWAVRIGAGDESAAKPAALSASPPIEVGPFEQVAGAAGEFGVEPLSEEPDVNGDVIATAEIAAVAAGDRGMVAVGNLNGMDGGIGSIWFSADGEDWQRVPHDDVLFGVPGETPNTMIVDVAADDTGFLAVGVRFTEPRERIVWSSADGLGWERSEGPGLDAAAVTATDLGWMVVGSLDLQASIWTSPDGVRWESVTSTALTSDTHNLAVHDLAHDGERLVAVGDSGARDYREDRPVIWISDSGAGWERVSGDTGVLDVPTGSGIESVTAGPAGFVAVGEERIAEGDDPAFGLVWHSPDGVDWERIRLGPRDSGRPLTVVSSDAGYVVYGVAMEGDDLVTRLWTSTVGLTWDTVEPDGLAPHLPRTALMIDRQLLVFGSLVRGATEDGQVLYGEGAAWSAGL